MVMRSQTPIVRVVRLGRVTEILTDPPIWMPRASCSDRCWCWVVVNRVI